MMKKLLLSLITAATLALGSAALAADEVTPKSVIHVVTVAWKEGTTPEQIQAALNGVKTLAREFPGISRVWVKAINVQNPRGAEVRKTHAFVMEFVDEQALKNYAGSDAQKKWYEVYTPIREQSTTFDITN